MKRLVILAAALATAAPVAGNAADYAWPVVRVIDGDTGILTRAFFGRSHKGMGGTLERSDMIAAFGGSR